VVKAASVPGQGASFVIYLPLGDGRDTGEETTWTLLPHTKEALLVVDDDPDLLNLARRVLDEDGYNVVSASNGVEAEQIVRERGQDFALVILDMLSSPIGTVETYRRMRLARPELKVLLLSGYSRADEAQFLLGVGAAAHLQKPYSPDSLLRAVRGVIDGDLQGSLRAP
jgi:DNA-binding NtrC family response regulator